MIDDLQRLPALPPAPRERALRKQNADADAIDRHAPRFIAKDL